MENELVKKSNKLIESRYSWGLNEQKMILLIASNLNISKEKVLSFQIGQMKKVFGEDFKSKDLQKVIKGIHNKGIEIYVDDEDWEFINVFSWLKFKNGILTLELTDKIMPLIYNLKEKFTQYKLHEVINFKSQYSIRIYELLISENYRGKGLKRYDIIELRNILGIKENEYSRFNDFDRRVLKVAIDEINEKSNMVVKIEKERWGRNIRFIDFYFEIKNERPKEKISNEDLKFLCNLPYTGYAKNLNENLFRQLLKTYSKSEILQKINCLYDGNHINKPSAYLVEALKNDYISNYPKSDEEIIDMIIYESLVN